MFLAGILGTCMLLCVPTFGMVGGDEHLTLQQQADASGSSQSNKASSPEQNPQSSEGTSTSKSDSSAEKGQSSSVTKSGKKKKNDGQSTAENTTRKKKVVTRGGTDEPTTQISPSMTEEQAAKTRASTSNLITQTDENLAKLSSRQLTADEQETVEQIRKFVEQSKTADHEGDLPRAASLANKAKLLSEALVKP